MRAGWPPAPLVGVGHAPEARYGEVAAAVAPELPGGVVTTGAAIAVRDALLAAGLDAARAGTKAWNPLGDLIAPGERVVIKPNWVLHENRGGFGLDELVTHTEVLRAVVQYVVIARAGSLVIGDAPLQGCDFGSLREQMQIDRLREEPEASGIPCRIVDFRRKVLLGHLGDPVVLTDRGDEDFVLFDLGSDSLLEPITTRAGRYRVTMYPPDALDRTHRPGTHQYLVAREVIEADVVLNVPKLKTHMKAGVTGTLKNMVGMNGLKDYLPHHRKGGSADGGDCYEGRSTLLGWAEGLLDLANSTERLGVRRALSKVVSALQRLRRVRGRTSSVEGAWHGNDTVWRMCLDLQRILHFGGSDGRLHGEPARRVFSITDAILGGDHEGPLQVHPVPLGIVTASAHAAAAEWVHARLMGYDPMRVPLIRHAFALGAPWSFGATPPDSIVVRSAVGQEFRGRVPDEWIVPFVPAEGWVSHLRPDLPVAAVSA